MNGLRRNPYKLFIPLGVALTLWAVGHWLLHATGSLSDYRPLFHATVQIQGFLTAFAVGFLFTALPRRTQTEPPALWQIGAAMGALVTLPLAAWAQRWWVAQGAWLAVAAVLLTFAVPRLLSTRAGRRAPNSFLWIPIAILFGMAGSVITAGWGVGPSPTTWGHFLGRGLLFQGMFLCLVLGVGGLVFPVMTRGQPSRDATDSATDRRARLGHLAAAAAVAASFPLEVWISPRAGLALRGAVVLTVLLWSAELWRRPDKPGWNRRLIWRAGWLVPTGLIVAATLPDLRVAALHITFIGGFALLALGVGTQVTLGHQGYESIKSGRPWVLLAVGALLVVAITARVAVSADSDHFFVWLGVAATGFLAAIILWAVWLVPKMVWAGTEG